MYCCVIGCKSNKNNKKHIKHNPNSSNSTDNVKYYRFPKNPDMQIKWLAAIGRKDKVNVNNARVCSNHFATSDYEVNLKHQLLGYEPKHYRGLKKDAVPNLNLPNFDFSVETIDELSVSPIEEITIKIEPEDDDITSNTDNDPLDPLYQMRSNMIDTLLAVKKIFSKQQMEKLKNSNSKVCWSVNDITKAIALYSGGGRAYRLLLKRGFPLPTVATLKAWLHKLQVRPGIIRNLFKIVEAADFKEIHKVCALSIGEMKLCNENGSNDKFVQIIMMTGLFKAWKQPIYFNFNHKISASDLINIIRFLEDATFHVIAVVSDNNDTYPGFYKELKISFSRPFFHNPVNGDNVYVFADVPHILKSIRNHFLDRGFHVHDKLIHKYTVDLVMDKTVFTNNISKALLQVSGPERDKIKPAAQLFSNRVAKAIDTCGALGLYPENENWRECAKFFKLVNDWFDIFNISAPSKQNVNQINELLNEMSYTVLRLETNSRRLSPPFQKSILMSNNALKELLLAVQRRFGVAANNVLTRRLNMDVLENFVAEIKAKGNQNGYPTALEFKQRLRSYLLNKSSYSVGSNAEMDGTPNYSLSAQLVSKLTNGGSITY